MRISTLFFIIALFFTSLTASRASAASITINSSGDSSYQVVGNGLSGVAGLKVIIRYDQAILANPKVTQGPLASGAMLVANTNKPGEITIGLITTSTLSGNGSIAEIAFARRGDSGGGVTNITVEQAIDNNQKPLPISAGLGNISGSSGTGSSGSSPVAGLGGTSTTIPGTQSGATGTAAIGTLSLQGDAEAAREKKTGEAAGTAATPQATPPATEVARQEPAPEATPPAKKEKRPLPGPPANVLELFKTYKGEPALKSMKKLFLARGGEWFVQNPPVAPADGKSVITLLLSTDVFGEKAPNFSLKGVEMKGVKTVDNAWAIEVIPAKDSLNSSISIAFDEGVVEVQIVTMPALPQSLEKVKLTEAEVNRILADRTPGKTVKGDLNGDGVHDYKDDYILVGNYLLKESGEPKKKESVKEGGKAAK
jgi:hypothetical protein